MFISYSSMTGRKKMYCKTIRKSNIFIFSWHFYIFDIFVFLKFQVDRRECNSASQTMIVFTLSNCLQKLNSAIHVLKILGTNFHKPTNWVLN